MIKSKTEYTEQLFNDFINFTLKRNKSLLVIYICSAIILTCSIIIIALGEYFQGALDAFLGLLFAFYGVITRSILKKSNKKNIGATDAYEFEENKFTITATDKDNKEMSKTTINYESLHAIELHKDYAYIYINKAVAYIVLKSNFSSEEDFNKVVTDIQNKISKN